MGTGTLSKKLSNTAFFKGLRLASYMMMFVAVVISISHISKADPFTPSVTTPGSYTGVNGSTMSPCGPYGSCLCLFCTGFFCTCTPSSDACVFNDCQDGATLFTDYHPHYRDHILDHITDEADEHEEWLEDTLMPLIIDAMQKMAEQISANFFHQAFSIGTFFDAKHHLETQNLLQELQVETYQDYQPSEEICTFGTAVRSFAHTDAATETAALALSRRQMARHTGKKNMGGAKSPTMDKYNRWIRFTNVYCDPQDNNWLSTDTSNTGLATFCNSQTTPPTTPSPSDIEKRHRVNIDIDFGRAVENKRVIDVYGGSWVGAGDELDVLTLSNNLYGHNIINRDVRTTRAADPQSAQRYSNMRSIIAKRGVAENSFNNIVALRTQSSTVRGVNISNTNLFLGRILMDLGIPEDEVVEVYGIDTETTNFVDPEDLDASYLAMLEILTKKVFQNPNFYANLYDTPANVERKAAALDAFDIMLDRAIYKSQLRREMAMSVLLSTSVENHMSARPNNVWGKER